MSGDRALVHGRAPLPETAVAISRFLDARGDPGSFATASLPALFPAMAPAKDLASGVLSFSLPGPPRTRLLPMA